MATKIRERKQHRKKTKAPLRLVKVSFTPSPDSGKPLIKVYNLLIGFRGNAEGADSPDGAEDNPMEVIR